MDMKERSDEGPRGFEHMDCWDSGLAHESILHVISHIVQENRSSAHREGVAFAADACFVTFEIRFKLYDHAASLYHLLTGLAISSQDC